MKEKTIFVSYRPGHNPEYFIRASTLEKAQAKASELLGFGIPIQLREPTRAERIHINLGRVKIEEAE